MFSRTEETKKYIEKIDDILRNDKLQGLDDETKRICESALKRMFFDLQAQVAGIERNVAMTEEYRESYQTRRP